jgi:hypothetical protein
MKKRLAIILAIILAFIPTLYLTLKAASLTPGNTPRVKADEYAHDCITNCCNANLIANDILTDHIYNEPQVIVINYDLLDEFNFQHNIKMNANDRDSELSYSLSNHHAVVRDKIVSHFYKNNDQFILLFENNNNERASSLHDSLVIQSHGEGRQTINVLPHLDAFMNQFFNTIELDTFHFHYQTEGRLVTFETVIQKLELQKNIICTTTGFMSIGIAINTMSVPVFDVVVNFDDVFL